MTERELRPAAVLRQALAEWGDLYDGDPVALPLPEGAPADVPQVLLSSRDGVWRLEVARADHARLAVTEGHGAGSGQVLPTLGERLARIAKQQGAVIGRLGAVVTRLAQVEEPGKTLARQFCRDEWLAGPPSRPEGFELHAHKTFALRPGLPVNSWVRIKAARAEGEPCRSVTVEQDINTLVEELEQRRFAAGEIVELLRLSAAESGVILERYLPPREREQGV